MNISNAWLAGHGLDSPGGKPIRLLILDTMGKLFRITFHVNGFPFGANPRRGVYAAPKRPGSGTSTSRKEA